MCLPFLCGDRHDHGSGGHPDTWQSPATDQGGGYPYSPPPPLKGANHGYGVVGKNGAERQGRSPPGVNVNRQPGAAFNSSDADMPPASVGVVRDRKGAAPAAPVRQTPDEHWVPKTVVPTPAPGAPAPVAASRPKQGATGTVLQTAPVPLVARRDEDDDDSTTAASSYTIWK